MAVIDGHQIIELRANDEVVKLICTCGSWSISRWVDRRCIEIHVENPTWSADEVVAAVVSEERSVRRPL